jgi:hypothetical protein
LEQQGKCAREVHFHSTLATDRCEDDNAALQGACFAAKFSAIASSSLEQHSSRFFGQIQIWFAEFRVWSVADQLLEGDFEIDFPMCAHFAPPPSPAQQRVSDTLFGNVLLTALAAMLPRHADRLPPRSG